ncbi:VOC family protein [Pseudonocardia humida]|uniref:VOC family protein n=1 Tax=Pseudonocardia humida TaxID=2800819 RepID=A0ABT1A8Y0_9PSEU|nr:VOC family protein [Pseudonocardia humida]MCO1659453.1 VOC family protein [Pseudonocardia humida]
MAPTLAPGKISYLQLPALDVEESAAFYTTVFGWRLRRKESGTVAFDDSVGEVSGHFETGLPPADRPGLLVHVLVADVEATLDVVRAAGGRVVEPAHGEPPEIYALIADPAGTVLGVFSQADG